MPSLYSLPSPNVCLSNLRNILSYGVMGVVLTLLLAASADAEGVVFIASANVPETSLTATDVMNIFLGTKTTWSNGSKITFVTLKDGEPHSQFLKDYIKRNPSQFKNHWKKMLFTGKGVIPKSFDTDEAVVDFVSKNDNMIGYISKPIENPGIKVLTISQ